MMYRLLMLIGVAILLVGEPAMADFALRMNSRGHEPATVQPNDDQEYYNDGYGYDDEYGYDDGYGDNDGYGYNDSYYYGADGYPLYLTPNRVPAPVVLPPIIARPVPPQPMIRVRLRGGGFIWVPNPHLRYWDMPRYSDYASSGLAYIPTPTYPFVPSRRHHHRHRGR